MAIDWSKYEKLTDLVKRLDIPYSTIHTWIYQGKVKGAIKRNGTQWMIPLNKVAEIEKGELDVGIRKGD
jgi:predicted site-specific integrase-resolvase